MTVTFTIEPWWIYTWLALGTLVVPLLAIAARARIHPRRTLRQMLWSPHRGPVSNAVALVAGIVVWPWTAWATLR